ncbi:glycosyltransferase family 2 protein [Rhodocytophaga rosea]|uniref:Glycosyltransferase family 2 protein n=1 Tax=Rhodocytophaga rosea TaxID=2704465 RepID=A0A6C0GDL2_9BACT|nr:glycosyltransferase family 2 protein [Rhodocytophaga rosea]QHT65770.1 glycosyltransferase family 2 protein [Rhodocytophaga rosea]
MEPEKKKYTISVALVTRNRADSLERCLRSLHQQTVQPFEIIISDDSDDEKKNETKILADKWNCKYISGPRRGLYANRNYVALVCKGTHIRTMDDDHEFPKDHFEKCYNAINNDPNSIWIIGEIYPDTKNPLLLPPPCPGQLHPRGYSSTPSDSQDCWAISCGASIYPAQIFKNQFLNVEFFKFGASYLEFGSRLHWLGYKIRQLEDTYIIHHYDKNNRSFSNRELELSSMFFAVFCHSFIYQRGLKNKLLTVAEVLKKIIFDQKIALHSLSKALHYFKLHKQHIRRSIAYNKTKN